MHPYNHVIRKRGDLDPFVRSQLSSVIEVDVNRENKSIIITDLSLPGTLLVMCAIVMSSYMIFGVS